MNVIISGISRHIAIATSVIFRWKVYSCRYQRVGFWSAWAPLPIAWRDFSVPNEPWPQLLTADEDAWAELPVTICNRGTNDLGFEVRVVNNLGEELLAQSGPLAPASKVKFMARVLAKYKETSDREPDPNGTVTAVTLRLRHTDLNGQWRDALDGLISIPVQVKPKAVKLETDALKSFDDI